jgi:hypothetical protein
MRLIDISKISGGQPGICLVFHMIIHTVSVVLKAFKGNHAVQGVVPDFYHQTEELSLYT